MTVAMKIFYFYFNSKLILYLYHLVERILKKNVIKSLLQWKNDIAFLGQVPQKKKLEGEKYLLT